MEGEWSAIVENNNNVDFFWYEQNQGTLIDGATEEDYFVDEPGTYNFIVSNNETGCFVEASITVEDNFSNPEATIEFPDTRSCCLLYTSPSPRDKRQSRMPSSA